MQSVTMEYPNSLVTYLAKNQSYLVAEIDARGSANRGDLLTKAIHNGPGLKEANDIIKLIE